MKYSCYQSYLAHHPLFASMILSKSNLGSLGKLAGACCYIPPPQENKIYQYRPIAPLQKKIQRSKNYQNSDTVSLSASFWGVTDGYDH